MTKTLSYHDAMRYNRHIVLPRVDLNGQEALLNATVVIIGMGGLGSAAATSLCASGVGNLVLIDFDTVDNTNLRGSPCKAFRTRRRDRLTTAAVGCWKVLDGCLSRFSTR